MAQQLHSKEQFKNVLHEYKPNAEATALLQKAPITLFDGPSASGRNTIMVELIETNRYQQIVSDTTRDPRTNNGIAETNGYEYWFKSEDEFLQGLAKGEYIEAAIIHNQQVSGVSVREIQRLNESSKIGINDVQPDGIDAFRAYKPDTICFFVVPPKFEKWLKRLSKRGDMEPQELYRRIESAKHEIIHALDADFYHFVINDNLNDAVALVDTICSGAIVDTSEAKRAAEEQLITIDKFLASAD